MNTVVHLLVGALAVLASAYIIPGVTVANFLIAILAALVLGLLNISIRPILLALTLPINVLTLGLFTIVINTLMIMLAAAIVPGFQVASFWSALVFGIVLWIVNSVFYWIGREGMDKLAHSH